MHEGFADGGEGGGSGDVGAAGGFGGGIGRGKHAAFLGCNSPISPEE